MKKILITATTMCHICHFHIPYMKEYQQMGYEVHVAAKNNLDVKPGLELRYVDRVFDIPFSRSPISRDNLKAKKQLKKIIDEEGYDVIITNTPICSVITRMTAKKARKRGTRVVYIAHGFHFYKGAPKKYWLTFYPIEKHFAKKCDAVVTINEEDYLFAKEKFKTKVHRIHGIGVDSTRHRMPTAEEREKLRLELGLSNYFVCLCTGELNKNKNQAKLIRLVPEIKKKIPEFKLLLAGNGPLEGELRALISELGVESAVELLGYRADIERYVRSADVVATASLREGVPFNVIEAQLTGVPVVASENRGHRELIKNGETGLMSDDGFSENIVRIYENKEFRDMIAAAAKEYAQAYTTESVKAELFEILFGSGANV